MFLSNPKCFRVYIYIYVPGTPLSWRSYAIKWNGIHPKQGYQGYKGCDVGSRSNMCEYSYKIEIVK